jgi:hypothetical protein
LKVIRRYIQKIAKWPFEMAIRELELITRQEP